MPRRAAHGEHVDGHQDDLASYVASVGLAKVLEADAITLEDLEESLNWRVLAARELAPVALI